MTRLYYDIIKDIPQSMDILDHHLIRNTGFNLLGLAVLAADKNFDEVTNKINIYSSAVIPVTSGKGIIPGFAEAVQAILKHIGLQAFITSQPDVGGFGEAYEKGADLIFAADDKRFLVFNPESRRIVDNAWATAAGFVKALEGAAQKAGTILEGNDVLVLGLGPVGSYSVKELQKRKAKVWIFDTDPAKMEAAVQKYKDIQIVRSIEEAMNKINYVLDATPSAEIFKEEMIQPETIISSPGVPHGLTPGALLKIEGRLIHDKLPLGIATMAVQALGFQ